MAYEFNFRAFTFLLLFGMFGLAVFKFEVVFILEVVFIFKFVFIFELVFVDEFFSIFKLVFIFKVTFIIKVILNLFGPKMPLRMEFNSGVGPYC